MGKLYWRTAGSWLAICLPLPNLFFNPRATAVLILGLGVLATAPAGAGSPLLPPLTGQLSGNFTLPAVPGAPPIQWTLELENTSPEMRSGQLSLTAPETVGQAEVALDATGDGIWRLREGRLALKPWLNGQFSRGEVTLTGEGTVQQGVVAGEVVVVLRDVELGELVNYADATHKYVRTAKGRVEGRVRVRLSAAPLSFDGDLRLAKGTTAVITLVPSPGLLTSYVPEQVRKLYPGIEAIELGQTALEARELRLRFHPAGDAAGRSAVLRIEGHPLDPQIIAPLELDVNISGPLESLLRKALDSRLRVGK